ncbi:MAG TPA: hypothetical protein VF369_07595 [candidate division Zixibacteria bacterium]
MPSALADGLKETSPPMSPSPQVWRGGIKGGEVKLRFLYYFSGEKDGSGIYEGAIDFLKFMFLSLSPWYESYGSYLVGEGKVENPAIGGREG